MLTRGHMFAHACTGHACTGHMHRMHVLYRTHVLHLETHIHGLHRDIGPHACNGYMFTHGRMFCTGHMHRMHVLHMDTHMFAQDKCTGHVLHRTHSLHGTHGLQMQARTLLGATGEARWQRQRSRDAGTAPPGTTPRRRELQFPARWPRADARPSADWPRPAAPRSLAQVPAPRVAARPRVSRMEPRAADGCFLGDVGFWVERTPVHEAAQRGESLQLQQLIESGACVNQVTVDSITPLHAASLQGQARCVQLLLAAGAQVDARNIDGSTPLCDACASGSIECVKLLLSYGAKVNPPLYTASPLHEACMSGSSECVRLLIDVGANLEAHDCHFGTPLHVACAREHLDCVKVLLNAGANVNAAKLHETALHHAAKVKNVDLIEMLIEFGGNIYARDNRGKKPSDYAWSSSAPAKCLEYYEKTPLTLSQLCRVSLRKATGVRGLEKIAKLNIPPRLIDYLSYN
ncbi:PREDICTED: ankyrin repeat and SOCS box protein 13 [Cercocebus atys]|nr:PREDICTED: ankyrin repeat and SOCS box protein 13 [Cercocebus atys]